MNERWTRGVRRLSVLVAAAALLTPAIAAAQGKISGKVTFSGTPPAPSKLKMDADPVCAAAHPGGANSEDVVVGDGGGLQNVFVYLKEVPGNFPAKSEPAVIDQKGCLYTPRVVGLQTGQPLKFLNSDSTLHNVHGMPKNNPGWNFAMPKFVKQKETKDLTKPEVMVAVKCDVHPWMAGYVGVLPHPFFAVTGKDGSFTIENVPPGEYEIVAWQEKLGTQSGKVKVDAGGAATSDFTFKAS
ncbi:MAG: carboxypeptidase regulatory-like domain-containing protein [Thermodesulfobacteriota bacterium]